MTALYKDDFYNDDGAVQAGRARDELRLTLNEMADEWDGSFALRLTARVMPTPRWVMAGAALAATVMLLIGGLPSSRGADSSGGVASIEPDALPVASLTPGASRNLSVIELCEGGVREEEEIPPALRHAVLRDYGMEHVPYTEYELDYLITPELGGAPDARNLWPQRYSSRTWNARVKDQLERLLPRLVCNRDVALETAQRDIARDWIAAYRKYFKTNTPLLPQDPDVRGVRLDPEKWVRPLFLVRRSNQSG